MTWEEEKISLLKRGFVVREDTIGSHEIVLIYPNKGNLFEIKWNNDIMKYRSSMWLKYEKKLISASFFKFFNWGEQLELMPLPTTLDNTILTEKIDGSALLISKYDNNLIIRTRGTIDASILDNGYEIDILKQKYPKVFDNEWINSEQTTLIFEWVSPTNQIVINYGTEPDIYLTGAVHHNDYTIYTQNQLNNIAQVLQVKRPKLYTFNSIPEMIETVQAFKGVEGICVYFGTNQQNILKLKGIDYLAKHAFKSHCTLDSVIDMFLSKNKPDFNSFTSSLATEFDYECCQMAVPHISRICEAYKEIEKIINHMKVFVEPLRTKSRRDAAGIILQAYGTTSRSGYAFKMLDNKALDDKDYKKLLFQLLKKL